MTCMHNKFSFFIILNARDGTESKYPSIVFLSILRYCNYLANRYSNANNCWHFKIHEQDSFSVELSMKKVL